MRKQVDIFNGYNKAHVEEADPSELMNLYVGQTSSGMALFNTPGISITNGTQISNTGETRKLFVSRLTTRMHAVGGSVIYQIDNALNYSFGIEMDTEKGYVGIIDNEDQILFVDGVSGYVYDKTTNVYSKITSPDFISSPADSTYLAGRFIVFKKDTNEWYYSAINDANDWDLNNRYELTSYPDVIEAITELNGRLYIMGRRCVEVWYPTVTSLSPFERDNNSTLDIGCVGAATASNEEGIVAWLARGKQGVTSIVAIERGSLTKISTNAIDALIQDFTDPKDASAFIYTINGNVFYQVNFTTDNTSLLYNFNTKKWSQLTDASFDRHRANCHAYFNQNHFVGDYKEIKIYDFDTKYVDDEIENNITIGIRRKIVTSRQYFNGGLGYCLDRVRILAKQGLGTEYGYDQIPYLEMRISYDGGASYGSTVVSKMGLLGRREWRTDFYRFGTMDSTVFELQYYNRTNFALFGMVAFIRGGEQ